MGLITTLGEAPPFNQLPSEVLDRFNQIAEVKTFPGQLHIFTQDDPPTGYLYIVKSGLVEIVVQTPGDVEMVVDFRKEGSFFGGTPVFTNQGYTAGARTAKETTCYLIPSALLLETAENYPHISEHFTKMIYSRVRNLYSEMVSEHSQNTLAQMEAYPFKKRLSEIMSTPVETCQPDTRIREIARRMSGHGI